MNEVNMTRNGSKKMVLPSPLVYVLSIQCVTGHKLINALCGYDSSQ